MNHQVLRPRSQLGCIRRGTSRPTLPVESFRRVMEDKLTFHWTVYNWNSINTWVHCEYLTWLQNYPLTGICVRLWLVFSISVNEFKFSMLQVVVFVQAVTHCNWNTICIRFRENAPSYISTYIPKKEYFIFKASCCHEHNTYCMGRQ